MSERRGVPQQGVGGDAGIGLDDIAAWEAEEGAREVACPHCISFKDCD